jgi:hypothetical protein
MIATKATVGLFVFAALAKSYLNVWGGPDDLAFFIAVWGQQ